MLNTHMGNDINEDVDWRNINEQQLADAVRASFIATLRARGVPEDQLAAEAESLLQRGPSWDDKVPSLAELLR
jgi:hypothetical protein